MIQRMARSVVLDNSGRLVSIASSPETPRGILVLLFAFGMSQFFLKPEPGAPELLFPLILLFATQRSLFHPVHVLLLGSNVFAVVFELLVFATVSWSAVSVYLTLTSVALLSIFQRFDRDACVKALLVGGGFGAMATLMALVALPHELTYRYGIRFTGFFKDPNVTAPTALFFAIALFVVRDRWRLVAIFPFIVFMISLSRATYLAAAVGLLYAVAFRNIKRATFGVLIVAAATLFWQRILSFVDWSFASVGRLGLINFYDQDRSSNWLELIELAWRTGAPLGPGFSESNGGMSVHSTYLRLLVEQGVVALVMFLVALALCWRAGSPLAIRTAFLCIIVNGVAIDATHWRVLFLAIPLTLAWEKRAAAASGSVSRTWRRRDARRWFRVRGVDPALATAQADHRR